MMKSNFPWVLMEGQIGRYYNTGLFAPPDHQRMYGFLSFFFPYFFLDYNLMKTVMACSWVGNSNTNITANFPQILPSKCLKSYR